MMSPTQRRINSATSSGSETLLFPSTEPGERLSMESAVQDRRQRSYPFVFATTGGVRPFSGFSKAKLAPDKHIAELGNSESRDPMRRWVVHDLRRTAKTLMTRAGVRPDIPERVLAHVILGVEGVYDRWGYLPEKYDALTRPAALVDRIITRWPTTWHGSTSTWRRGQRDTAMKAGLGFILSIGAVKERRTFSFLTSSTASSVLASWSACFRKLATLDGQALCSSPYS
jgi:hypothetical protein